MGLNERDMTTWSSDDWQAFLDKTEGNIDKELGFRKESLRFKRKSLDVLDFSKLSYDIDENKKKILFFYDGKQVGEISPGMYKYGDFVSHNHLLIELDKKYRGRGLGKKILEIYKQNFGLPSEEYTRKLNIYHFFISVGYVPVSILNDATGEENDFDETEDLGKIGHGYSCRFEYMG